jgi:hypothetical protein
MDWIDLAQDRDRWRTLVNTGMNLRVPHIGHITPEIQSNLPDLNLNKISSSLAKQSFLTHSLP